MDVVNPRFGPLFVHNDFDYRERLVPLLRRQLLDHLSPIGVLRATHALAQIDGATDSPTVTTLLRDQLRAQDTGEEDAKPGFDATTRRPWWTGTVAAHQDQGHSSRNRRRSCHQAGPTRTMEHERSSRETPMPWTQRAVKTEDIPLSAWLSRAASEVADLAAAQAAPAEYIEMYGEPDEEAMAQGRAELEAIGFWKPETTEERAARLAALARLRGEVPEQTYHHAG